MAFFWFLALRREWGICRRVIYDLPFKKGQLRRELKNSVHAPMHALWLWAFVSMGLFAARGLPIAIASFLFTACAVEVWHYGSHRAFHLPRLHWIHVEHHKSRLCTPLTAMSFSFTEKLIFDLGLLAILAGVDQIGGLDFRGIAVWFVVYMVVNSVGHANFEIQSKAMNRILGPVFTTTTYHALHHSRYTGHYGLSTRFMDRLFDTEWEDYSRLVDRISREERPLKHATERV